MVNARTHESVVQSVSIYFKRDFKANFGAAGEVASKQANPPAITPVCENVQVPEATHLFAFFFFFFFFFFSRRNDDV